MSDRPRTARRRTVVVAALCVVALAVVVGVALRGHRNQSGPVLQSPAHARRDLSVALQIGPSLRELQAHFAVLRRPATAGEHALLATFTAPTDGRPEVPEYVRQVGVVDGIRVYLIVMPIFKHEVSGPVVAYRMAVSAAGAGFSYAPGNYLIFPSVAGGYGKPQAYVSLVPDGVRAVRWRFTCGPNSASSGCRLPPQRVVTVPVRDDLAVLPTTTGYPGAAFPTVDAVTWYRDGGSRTVFANQDAAVPFPGAPAWR